MGTAVITPAAGPTPATPALPAAGTITGAELIEVTQSGAPVQTTVSAIQGGSGGSLGLITATTLGQNYP